MDSQNGGEEFQNGEQINIQDLLRKYQQQTMDSQKQLIDSQNAGQQSHHRREIDTEGLLNTYDGLGMGFLIGNITYSAIKVAINKGETPYAAFSPNNSEKLYLLSILQMNDTKQLLRPAVIKDLESSGGVKIEAVTVCESEEVFDLLESPAGIMTRSDVEMIMPTLRSELEMEASGEMDTMPKLVSFMQCDRKERSDQKNDDMLRLEIIPGLGGKRVQNTRTVFSHVAVVALVKQVFDQESGLCNLSIEPSANHVIEKVELCKPEAFVRHSIRCQVKRLRCFSEVDTLMTLAYELIYAPPPQKKRRIRKLKYEGNSEEIKSENVANN